MMQQKSEKLSKGGVIPRSTPTTLQSALSWHDQGVCPVPCRPKSKIAALPWRRWQTALPSQALVTRWFTNDQNNVALVTGGPSRLLVLDFDRFAAWINWRRDHPVLAKSYTERTARGVHVFLRTIKQTSSMHLANVDVLADRHMVVVAPSCHPTGARYEIFVPGEILTVDGLGDCLPELDERELDVDLRPISPTESCKPAAYLRHDLVGQIKSHFPVLAYAEHITCPMPSSRDGRWYIARCPHPQHVDRNPSFWIDIVRDVCGCFVCKESQPNRRSMDVINLHGWLTGLSNREAILDLAERLIWRGD